MGPVVHDRAVVPAQEGLTSTVMLRRASETLRLRPKVQKLGDIDALHWLTSPVFLTGALAQSAPSLSLQFSAFAQAGCQPCLRLRLSQLFTYFLLPRTTTRVTLPAFVNLRLTNCPTELITLVRLLQVVDRSVGDDVVESFLREHQTLPFPNETLQIPED